MTQDDRMETNPTRANGGPVRGDAPLVSGECPYPAVIATRYPDRAIGTVAGVTIIESHDPQASTYAEHMETITDRAEIRATDEPDPFRRNPVRRTGPDDPWRFTRFVADDHECVIVRDEYDEPAPFGSCSTHRRALSSPVALGCTTPAPVGAAVALDLDAAEPEPPNAVEVDESGCSCKIGPYRGFQRCPIDPACPKHGEPLRHGDGDVRVFHPDGSTSIIREPSEAEHLESLACAVASVTPCSCSAQRARAEAAEAEVVTLRAKVAAVEARLAAVEAHPVVLELAEERTRQTAKHGDQSHLPDGTGAALWLSMDDDYIRRHGIRRDNLAAWAKIRTDEASQVHGDGSITFEHILTEEWAEAIAESDPVALRAELVQVAAVAVQWVEAIDLRAALATTGEGQ